MSNFKPSICIRNKNHEPKWRTFKTYAELKKNLPQAIEDTIEDYVTVSRSRRGEWGEWFEHWILFNGNLVKIKEGWL
jgi:hypothetical protein